MSSDIGLESGVVAGAGAGRGDAQARAAAARRGARTVG